MGESYRLLKPTLPDSFRISGYSSARCLFSYVAIYFRLYQVAYAVCIACRFFFQIRHYSCTLSVRLSLYFEASRSFGFLAHDGAPYERGWFFLRCASSRIPLQPPWQ